MEELTARASSLLVQPEGVLVTRPHKGNNWLMDWWSLAWCTSSIMKYQVEWLQIPPNPRTCGHLTHWAQVFLHFCMLLCFSKSYRWVSQGRCQGVSVAALRWFQTSTTPSKSPKYFWARCVACGGCRGEVVPLVGIDLGNVCIQHTLDHMSTYCVANDEYATCISVYPMMHGCYLQSMTVGTRFGIPSPWWPMIFDWWLLPQSSYTCSIGKQRCLNLDTNNRIQTKNTTNLNKKNWSPQQKPRSTSSPLKTKQRLQQKSVWNLGTRNGPWICMAFLCVSCGKVVDSEKNASCYRYIYIYIFLYIYIYIRTSTQVLKVALHCRIWWFAIPSWRSAGSSGSCCLWRCGRCRGCGICADGHWIHGSKFPLDSFQWPDLVVAVCVLKAVEEFYSSIYILHVRLRISLQSLVVMVMVIKQSLHDCVFFSDQFCYFLGLFFGPHQNWKSWSYAPTWQCGEVS